jgi:hypothetical protein
MNWSLIWTVVGLAVAGLFISPIYIGYIIAYKKAILKIELEFVKTANYIHKKTKFDNEVERLFEEGEAI